MEDTQGYLSFSIMKVQSFLRYIVTFFEISHLEAINPVQTYIPVSFFLFLAFLAVVACIQRLYRQNRAIGKSVYDVQKYLVTTNQESDESIEQIRKDMETLERHIGHLEGWALDHTSTLHYDPDPYPPKGH